MRQRDRLLSALSDGPATSQELHLETGIPLRNVPVLLARMMAAGQVQRYGTAPASLQYGRRQLVEYARADA